MHLKKTYGFTLLGALAGILCISAALWLVASSSRGSEHSTRGLRDKVIAEAYVTETLETFRAMSGRELAQYLEKNPNNPADPAYPLCAHINIIDRSQVGPQPTILNPDPNVALGANLLNGPKPHLLANRFYKVEVVDILTVPPTKIDYCTSTVSAAPPPTPAAANVYYAGSDPNERFLVTVGVSWVPHSEKGATPERIAYSTILPNW